jgi:prepilin-type N-terminal cleavage/methylation domain-containing protein
VTTRRGFTLVEILVALAITGIIALLVRGVFGAVTEGIGRLRASQQEIEARQLGLRWLHTAFLSLEAGNRGLGFEGHADRVAFSSWLMTSSGWLERTGVALGLDEGRLVAGTGQGVTTIRTGVKAIAFDYLLEPGLDSRWVTDWVSDLTAPLAVRLRLERADRGVDTLLFLIKGRG